MNSPLSQTRTNLARTPENPLQLAQDGKRGWQFDWLRWAFKTGLVATLKGAQPMVLFSLLSHANRSGYAWPSVQTIADQIGRDTRPVQRALSSLIQHDRKFIRRIKTGNYGTHTYQFLPFELLESPHTTPVKNDTPPPSKMTPTPVKNDTRTQGLNSENELIVEKADDDIFNSQSGQGSEAGDIACSLFASDEAVHALVDGFGFRLADARNQVKAFGPAAVIEAVKSVGYLKNNNIPVQGKPVKNWKGLLIRHLSTGMPEHPSVTEAREKAAKAEQLKLAREQAEQERQAQQARDEQDRAIVQMFMANVDQESIRQQLIIMHEQSSDPADQRIAKSYRKMPLTHPILQSLIESYVINQNSNQAPSLAAAGTKSLPSVLDE